MTRSIKRTTTRCATDFSNLLKSLNNQQIKQQTEDVAKATGLMLSAFSVVGLFWLIIHKKK